MISPSRDAHHHQSKAKQSEKKKMKKKKKLFKEKGNIQYNKNFIELFTIQIIFLLSYHGCSKNNICTY